MMVPYHYLNKLLVDKFTGGSRRRSGNIKISQASTSIDLVASTRQHQVSQKLKYKQQQLASSNKENLKPDDEVQQSVCREQEHQLHSVNLKTNLEQTGKIEEEQQQQQQQPPLKRKVLASNDTTNSTLTVSNCSSARIMKHKQRQLGQGPHQFSSARRHHHLLRNRQGRGANHTFAILDNNMSCPTILYTTAFVLIVMSSLRDRHRVDCAPNGDDTYLSSSPSSSSSSLFSRENSRSPPVTFPPIISSIDWNRIGTALQRQFLSIRWPPSPATRILSDSSGSSGGGAGGPRDPFRAPIRRRINPLVRAVDRIRSQMGARNTIRVHNAFRDFAWRVLSSLSMPTPVIYELRRQNFYSPDEDLANDSYYNKNTTKTIRSKRLIDPAKVGDWLSAAAQHVQASRSLQAKASKTSLKRASDDDDEPETVRDRLRMRLNDLLSLSRRSLFGRVVRLPSLFPFKRHEEDEDSDGDDRSDKNSPAGGAKSTAGTSAAAAAGGGGAGKQTGAKRHPSTGIRLLTMGAASRRKRKEADRQMISINGKQYYVDDDGELKEWKEQA